MLLQHVLWIWGVLGDRSPEAGCGVHTDHHVCLGMGRGSLEALLPLSVMNHDFPRTVPDYLHALKHLPPLLQRSAHVPDVNLHYRRPLLQAIRRLNLQP